ncbi:MAG: cation diffusion facilitator family transporter [Candidatus Uhrbacteria bacterium]|nr:cation diffusion facilitator family transporter [Candidatus Uhrbacteria bacterium]
MSTRVYSPYTVMTIVVIMYLVKVVCKLSIGLHINSPMLTGDGFHNIADIVQAMFVIVAVAVSRMPASDKYPFGRKNIESIFSVVVGVSLCLMAVKIGWESMTTLARYLPVWAGLEAPFTSPLKMGNQYVTWVVAVTSGSALLSVIVGRFQIRAGKAMGHEALVADGKETLSDGRIEAATFAGVLGEYLFHAPWIEYPFAILVAGLMIRTGIEISLYGYRALLQRTIGRAHDQAMKVIITAMPGVADVADLKSFRVGPRAIVIAKVLTHADARASRLLKHGIITHVTAYLREHEFDEAELFIRFDRPDPKRERRAVAVRSSAGGRCVAASLEYPTHLIICDMEFDCVSRATVHEVAALEGSVLEFLHTKKVTSLVLFAPSPKDALLLRDSSIDLCIAQSSQLSTLGL